ncbi:MAG TPA: OmpA family protein [Bacteroidetes bacterium]|nr:OmpA family protein [Bacteroidota bacterium]
MFPRLALLPIGLFIIWCFVCQRWYVCHIKSACEEQTVEPPPPPPPPDEIDNRPLVFKWADATPIARPDTFPGFKQNLLKDFGPNQVLEITGNYFKDETAPEGYANMGEARAALVKALFIPPLAEGQFKLHSKLIDPAPPGVMGDTLFESARFAVNTKMGEVDCIKNNNGALVVLFPYGQSQREVDRQIEQCLGDVIENLKATSDKAHIVGHTDDAGSDGFNMGLGLRRAKHIKGILVSNGIAADRISVESKGEREPIADNGTEEGSRRNRRAVLTILK